MIFLTVMLILFFIFLVSFKFLGFVENMISSNLPKETFINSQSIDSINRVDECSKVTEKYNKYLATPVAVNVPNQEFQHNFYIGENNENNAQLEVTSGYCFPIKDFRYDSVWTGYKVDNSDDFEKIDWKNKRKIIKYNCSNNLIIKPNKILRPNETIVNLYPQHLNNELIRKLNMKNICLDQPEIRHA